MNTPKLNSRIPAIILLSISMMLFLSCDTKTLNAYFTLSSTNVKSGETVFVTDVTPDADEYHWYVDNDLMSTSKFAQFVFTTGGSRTIRLDVKRGKKDSKTYKSITITHLGTVVFWMKSSRFQSGVNVSVSNTSTQGFGQITGGSLVPPACFDAGAATFTMGLTGSVTTVFYSANEFSGQSWSGNVQVFENDCASVEFE